MTWFDAYLVCLLDCEVAIDSFCYNLDMSFSTLRYSQIIGFSLDWKAIMPTDLTLTSIPIEIVIEILSHTSDLHGLLSILLSHSTFYIAFQSRRAHILKSTFRKQVFRWYLYPGKYKNESVFLHRTKSYIESLLPDHKADAVLLYEAIWPYFESRMPSKRPLAFANLQTHAYARAGMTKEALVFGEKAWKEISPNKPLLLYAEWNCAKVLSQCYKHFGRTEEAVALLEGVLHRVPRESPDFRTLELELKTSSIQLSEEYWNAARFDDCASFQKRMWQLAVQEKGESSANALDWARSLVFGYSRRGMKEAAAEWELKVVKVLHSSSMSSIQWSRHLIRTMKGMGRMTEALIIRLAAWHDYRPEREGYHAWARELAGEYRALNCENEAVAVEEIVWQETKRRILAAPKNSRIVNHVRVAGEPLVKSYRRQERFDLVLSIKSEMSECQDIISQYYINRHRSRIVIR